MLKYFDQGGVFVRMISEIEYENLQITRTLSDGDKTLSFTYLGKYTDLSLEGYIETDEDRYVIKEIMPKSGSADFKCQLDVEPLEASTIRQFTAKDKTIQLAANAALVGTGWTCSVDSGIATKVRSVQQFNKTPFELLLKIRDAFMCEIRFNSKTKVVSYKEQYGSDRGVYLRPELNLVDVSLTLDSYDFYTRIIPVGENGLTIESINQGKNYVENYQYSTKIRTLYWEDTNYTDTQALKDDAIGKLADLSKPKRSYSASVRDLAKLSADYGILDYDIGDTVTITDEPSGIRDKQRIVSITEYPEDPERNTVELSNTVLTWEEYQSRLEAAANAWEDVSNADGSINGVYVHGVQAGDVVKVQVDVNGQTVERNLNQAVSIVQGDIDSVNIRVGTVETTYLQATMANVDTANINTAKVKDLFVQVGLIRDAVIDGARITGYLDAVSVNAASITAGTLVADRIAIRGSNTALVYALNNYGQIVSSEVNTLDGYIVTPRTIEADKIVAHSITATEITTQNLVGTNGWINLAQGTFAFGGDALTWNGQQLMTGPFQITGSGFSWSGTSSGGTRMASLYKDGFTLSSTNSLSSGNYWKDTAKMHGIGIISVSREEYNSSDVLVEDKGKIQIAYNGIAVYSDHAAGASSVPYSALHSDGLTFYNIDSYGVGLFDGNASGYGRIINYKPGSTTLSSEVTVDDARNTGEARLNVDAAGYRKGRLVATVGSSRFGLYDVTNSAWVVQSDPDQTVTIPHKLKAYGASTSNARNVIVTENESSSGTTIGVMITSASNLIVQARWGTTTYSNRSISVPASDARLKANITSATKSALDVVKALKIRQFDWKDGHGHWDFGLIAQEAREIDQNIVVGEETENQYLSMDTLYLVDILTKAIQELSDQLDQLRRTASWKS